MRLKMFIYHNPNTEKPEKIYEFPWCEASTSEISLGGKNLYSREPMKRPVLMIDPTFLTEIKNQRFSVDPKELFKNQHEQQQQNFGETEL